MLSVGMIASAVIFVFDDIGITGIDKMDGSVHWIGMVWSLRVVCGKIDFDFVVIIENLED